MDNENNTNTNQQQHHQNQQQDSIGAIADALFMINLLLAGLFYIALWILYFLKYKDASQVSKNHLKQALIGASLSIVIFLAMSLFAVFSSGFNSATTLIMAEIYLMVIVPLFLFVGILAFTKAINDKDYAFPIIGKMLGIKTG